MSAWFEGASDIECTIADIKRALDDPGALYVGVISLMPGLTAVELVDQGSDYVIIKTNEGLMTRTNISIRIDADSAVVELDEEYRAGSRLTTTSHFSDAFTTSEAGVTHRVVISTVEASGVLGFFYRTFGSTRTGNAFLAAYRAYFEDARV